MIDEQLKGKDGASLMMVNRELLVFLATSCLICASTCASEFAGLGMPNGPSVPGPEGVADYQLDDGSAEGNLGVSLGGNIIWLNQFTVEAGFETITDVSFTIGSAFFNSNGGLVGARVSAHVWGDPDNDGDPNNAVLLGSGAGTVENPDTDLFQDISVGAINVGSAGDSFFVGVQISHAPGELPVSLDTTAPFGRSWVSIDTQNKIDPADLSSAEFPPLLIDDAFTPANFMVRGFAVPEPSSLLMVASIPIVFRRR